jgi:hypothetical protein
MPTWVGSVHCDKFDRDYDSPMPPARWQFQINIKVELVAISK